MDDFKNFNKHLIQQNIIITIIKEIKKNKPKLFWTFS